jgi:drug/metabolite transporter (DMT)-like permease
MSLTLQYISLADTRTIGSAAVITVYFCGWLFLGEKLGIVPVLVAFLAFFGIGVMMRPPLLTGGEELSRDTMVSFIFIIITLCVEYLLTQIGIGLAISYLFLRTSFLVMMRYLKDVHEGLLSTSLNCGFG